MSGGWKIFEKHDRKILHWPGQTVNRNMDVKDSPREGSGRSQEHWRGSLYHLREFIRHHKENVGRIVYPLHFSNIDKSKCNSRKRSSDPQEGKKKETEQRENNNMADLNPNISIIVLNLVGLDFPGGTVVKNLPANAGDTSSSPGPGRFHMPRSG